MAEGLSVVIPSYNEAANVRRCLTQVFAVLKKLDLDWEIVVVDDGSSDNTGLIAKQLAKKIPHLRVVENRPNLGYGGALRRGFVSATKDLVAFIPADNQFDFAEITLFLDRLRQTDCDIVGGIRVHTSDPLHRRLLRWVWNKMVYALFGQLASDIDCGFKLFKRKILTEITLTSNGAMIDTQLFAGARVKGMRIEEISVSHYPRLAGSSTGAHPKVALRAVVDLLGFWWQLKQEVLVEQGRAVFRWEALLLLLILGIAAFFRLWHIDQYLTFLGDEGRDALAVREIVLGRHFPLIGPGTSIGSMYLGPLYYYLVAPALALSGFSPVGPAILVALLGVATVALLWWIGRQWFGREPALVTSFLYAISPTVIIYSRSSWNPNIMPFFALLTIYGIWKVWRLGYWRWLVVVGVSLAFVLQSHYLGLLLLPVVGLFWWLAPKSPQAWRHSLLALLVFVVLMSPLAWFDLRHGGNNTRSIITFFANRQTTVNLKAYKALPRLWPIWQDVTGSLLTAKNVTAARLTAALLALAALIMLWRRPAADLKFTLVWLGVGLVGLGLYKQHIYDHYYGFMFAAPFLLAGFALQAVRSRQLFKIAVVLGTVALVAVNLAANPLRFPPQQQLERTRQVADLITTVAAGQPFNLALIAKQNYDKSYVYFLTLNSAPYLTIHQKLTEQLFVVCEELVCEPINHPLWEIAAFGWAKIDRQWEFPWGVKLFRLIHNPSGK